MSGPEKSTDQGLDEADGLGGACPLDDYTPHGYLNLPGHTARLAPRGVSRSRGVGFSWHFPALASAYGGSRERYRAGMRLKSVPAAEVKVPYHSSNVKVFEVRDPAAADVPRAASLRTTWVMANDDVLCARLDVSMPTHVDVVVDYERLLAEGGGWGESGLAGRVDGDIVLLSSFESGEAFAFRAIGALEVRARTPWTTIVGKAGDQVGLQAEVTCAVADPVWLVLARGVSRAEARARVERVGDLGAVLADRLAADEEFWRDAPVLSGDWPEHWRRGVVYDLETLRMMVKEPAGVYRRRWDAMQIQAPRTVLAETAMDALALARACPRTAADVLSGVLADAGAANVPCTREDGSDTMVSADGTVCGTGPEWGLPFVVVERLRHLLDDDAWPVQVYQPLAEYLEWWLAHRRDSDGWLVHACSWESGQDLSPRFGDQPLGGGHPTWHLRPVDLHAAAAHAARVLRMLAAATAPDDVERWSAIEEEMTRRTRELWNGRRFADVDARTGRFTDIDDVMLLLPLALDVATPEQAAALLRSSIEGFDADALVWPMFVWTAVLAAQTGGRHGIAASLSATVIDRAYQHWDSRSYDGTGTLPGVACEYWPLHGRCGGEGYGWGAFTVELLLDAVIGLRAGAEGVRLRPALPSAWRVPGRRYRVDVTLRNRRHQIVLEPRQTDLVAVAGLGEAACVPWEEPLFRSWSQLE